MCTPEAASLRKHPQRIQPYASRVAVPCCIRSRNTRGISRVCKSHRKIFCIGISPLSSREHLGGSGMFGAGRGVLYDSHMVIDWHTCTVRFHILTSSAKCSRKHADGALYS